jgi:hypothetical protein
MESFELMNNLDQEDCCAEEQNIGFGPAYEIHKRQVHGLPKPDPELDKVDYEWRNRQYRRRGSQQDD